MVRDNWEATLGSVRHSHCCRAVVELVAFLLFGLALQAAEISQVSGRAVNENNRPEHEIFRVFDHLCIEGMIITIRLTLANTSGSAANARAAPLASHMLKFTSAKQWQK
jgi:predicted membrane channel-forming protein YqfA (hemolysin III family)